MTLLVLWLGVPPPIRILSPWLIEKATFSVLDCWLCLPFISSDVSYVSAMLMASREERPDSAITEKELIIKERG